MKTEKNPFAASEGEFHFLFVIQREDDDYQWGGFISKSENDIYEIMKEKGIKIKKIIKLDKVNEIRFRLFHEMLEMDNDLWVDDYKKIVGA